MTATDTGGPLTIADLLEERLRQLGVMRVYGLPLARLQQVPVDDVDLAVLLADADGRLGHHDGSGRLGAALLDGPILHLSSQPGGRAPLQTVVDAEQLLDVLADPPGMDLPGVLALHLDLDLGAPVPPGLSARHEPARTPVVTLDPAMAGLSMVVLVGPGVVRASGVDNLSELVRKAGIGVVNTWGAKGVERWDSPFHFGTAGLQARDFELAGIAAADVVITCGIDRDEVPSGLLEQLVVQDVAAGQLHALVHRWTASRSTPERPPLYETLARVVTPRYESDAVPLTAARASLHLSGALPERGVAVADPGRAGFWVARTFPTSIPGSVCVPATGGAGFAAAAALVCRLEARPCLAVADQVGGTDGLDDTSAAVLELAEALGLPVALQLWGPDGRLADSTAHVRLLEQHLTTDVVRIDEVPVEVADTAELEAAAGELIAW
jgi:hypothetical protein